MRRIAIGIMAALLLVGCTSTQIQQLSWLAEYLIDRKDKKAGIPSFDDLVKAEDNQVSTDLKDQTPEGVEIVYLDRNVGDWKITQSLRFKDSGGKLHYTSADPTLATHIGDGWKDWRGSIGNCWVGIPGEYIPGADSSKIIASTWEWWTKAHNPRTKAHLGGGIFKKPRHIPTSWMPKDGMVLYHMVSGAARGGADGTHERTQWIKAVWKR